MEGKQLSVDSRVRRILIAAGLDLLLGQGVLTSESVLLTYRLSVIKVMDGLSKQLVSASDYYLST